MNFLLENGADPSLADLVGRTPLHWASFYGHSKVVDALINKNAPINIADDEGVYPIHLACLSGQIDCVSCLTNANADLSVVDKHLRTPMHYAAKASSGPVLQFLLANRVNPDVVDDAGDTPTMLIEGQCVNEMIEMIQYSGHPRSKLRKSSAKPSMTSVHF